jgi:hypothetical protein
MHTFSTSIFLFHPFVEHIALLQILDIFHSFTEHIAFFKTDLLLTQILMQIISFTPLNANLGYYNYLHGIF